MNGSFRNNDGNFELFVCMMDSLNGRIKKGLDIMMRALLTLSFSAFKLKRLVCEFGVVDY